MADIRPLKRTSIEKSAEYSSSVIHNLNRRKIVRSREDNEKKNESYSALAFECGATRMAESADQVICVSNVESLP